MTQMIEGMAPTVRIPSDIPEDHYDPMEIVKRVRSRLRDSAIDPNQHTTLVFALEADALCRFVEEHKKKERKDA